jgi:hypothetical protein
VFSRQREVTPPPPPATLEERLAALESGREMGEDFDRRSWFWMILLGAVIPAVLLCIGWWGA